MRGEEKQGDKRTDRDAPLVIADNTVMFIFLTRTGNGETLR